MLISRLWLQPSTKIFRTTDDVGPDAEFVPSPAASPAALAPRMTCLKIPTPDALKRPSDTKGHLQRGI
jgi:hypothetical protein